MTGIPASWWRHDQFATPVCGSCGQPLRLTDPKPEGKVLVTPTPSGLRFEFNGTTIHQCGAEEVA